MAELCIELDVHGRIRFSMSQDSSRDDWQTVLSWWFPSHPLIAVPREFAVDVSLFAAKKGWLRENWTRLGHTVKVGPGVVEASRKVDTIGHEFKELTTNTNHGDEVDLGDLDLLRPLTSFQKSNVKSLVTMRNGANFSVPGAGKTATSLATYAFLRREGLVSQLLVVCPRSAFDAWRSEPKEVLRNSPITHQFDDRPIPANAELLYVNYEQLESPLKLRRVERWAGQRSTMMVIDEAHRIKGGEKSVRWRSCLSLSEIVSRVDLLTGTPMPQGVDDLRNLLNLSWSGLPKDFLTDSRLRQLRRGGIYVRTTKRELALPPLRVIPIELEMSTLQSHVYAALRRTYAGQMGMPESEQTYFARRGRVAMTLLAAATNPGVMLSSSHEDAYLGVLWPPAELTGSETLMSVLQRFVRHDLPPKYEWVARFVDEAARQGRKVLVWSTLIGNLLSLERVLGPYKPALVYGSTSSDERRIEIDRFRSSADCSVLLTNPQTLGEGISLHKECHDAIFLDRSYNAGLYLQALDRIHRLGLASDQETNIYLLQSAGTIDERVSRRLTQKIERLAAYMDDAGLVEVALPSADGEDLPDSVLGLDEVDLDDILSHLRADGE